MNTQVVTLDTLPAAVANVLAAATALPATEAAVVTLSGTVGAGKTTFVQALARTLGVEEVITSPTFVILKSYPTTHTRFTRLVHIDAYRLEASAELVALGLIELYADPATLLCIEWPEHVADCIPSSHIGLTLETKSENERLLTLTQIA